MVITPVITDWNSASANACCISHAPCPVLSSRELSRHVLLNTLQSGFYGTIPWISLAAEFRTLKMKLWQMAHATKGINRANLRRVHAVIQTNTLRKPNPIAICASSKLPKHNILLTTWGKHPMGLSSHFINGQVPLGP